MKLFDDIWEGIGNFGADADKFMKREMPFDMGWGAPAAVVAAVAAPEIVSTMGGAEGAAGASSFMPGEWGISDLFGSGNVGTGTVLENGGLGSYLDSLGMGDGGEFIPTAGNSFSLDFLNPSTMLPWEETGSGLTGNGFSGYTPQEQAGLDDLIAKQSAKYPMDGAESASKKPSFQQLLGKQLMSGGLKGLGGGGGAGFQYQEQPVQRQQAFVATPQPLQVQQKDSDIAALIAALRKKDFE